MDVETADAIKNLTVEDVTAAAPGTPRATHRIAKIHPPPPHWRQGNQSSHAVVVCPALVNVRCICNAWMCTVPISMLLLGLQLQC